MRRLRRNLEALKPALAAALLLACACAHGEPMILHLTNGDRLTGTIASEDARELVLLSDSLGRLTVPLVQITKREPLNPPSSEGSRATVLPKVEAAPSAAPPPVQAANVKPEPKKETPPKPRRWNSDLQIGVNLRYTTRDSEEYLVIAKTTYGRDKFRQIFDANFTYGKTEDQLSANRMSGSAKTEYDISKRGYVFNLLGAGYDEVRAIDVQYELSPGLGYQLFNSTKQNLVISGEAGFSYTDQFRNKSAGGLEKQTYAARLAGIFSWRVHEKLTSNGRMEFFPDFERTSEYRIRSELTLGYPLLKNTSLNLLLIDLYDTEPGFGVSNNDLQVRSTVGLHF